MTEKRSWDDFTADEIREHRENRRPVWVVTMERATRPSHWENHAPMWANGYPRWTRADFSGPCGDEMRALVARKRREGWRILRPLTKYPKG